MLFFLVFAAVCASCLAAEYYSFSPPVGTSGGTSFALTGNGQITAVRLWEHNSAYIAGIQVRFGYIWSEIIGRKQGPMQEIYLDEGEAIIQISGKYQSNYIYQLIFVTNRGRSLIVGQPTSTSFNMYPTHSKSQLIMLSGRYNSNGITSLGAHWGLGGMSYGNSTDMESR
uniref:Jacalin-type lectin domain-containing protein n=1 Tax=Mola mola TaxID=94237 RepID=A0A3Q3WD19_MOLML